MSKSNTALKSKDIFSKAFEFTKAEEVRALGLYPYFKPLTATDGTVVEIEGKQVIMAGSNNYLGLTNDPRVLEAARAAILKYGSGCTGSRYLNGTLDLHLELEEKTCGIHAKRSLRTFLNRVPDQRRIHSDHCRSERRDFLR